MPVCIWLDPPRGQATAAATTPFCSWLGLSMHLAGVASPLSGHWLRDLQRGRGCHHYPQHREWESSSALSSHLGCSYAPQQVSKPSAAEPGTMEGPSCHYP